MVGYNTTSNEDQYDIFLWWILFVINCLVLKLILLLFWSCIKLLVFLVSYWVL